MFVAAWLQWAKLWGENLSPPAVVVPLGFLIAIFLIAFRRRPHPSDATSRPWRDRVRREPAGGAVRLMTSGRAAPPISPNPSEQHELCFAFGGEGFAPDLTWETL